ncbi:hypothetical protein BC826DRAFT_1191447, partial [Russula brevipes]
NSKTAATSASSLSSQTPTASFPSKAAPTSTRLQTELSDVAPIVHTSIGGTRIVRRLTTGNCHGFLVPSTTTTAKSAPRVALWDRKCDHLRRPCCACAPPTLTARRRRLSQTCSRSGVLLCR